MLDSRTSTGYHAAPVEKPGEIRKVVLQRERTLECAFLIPVVRNSDRQPHQPLTWILLKDNLVRKFPGLTGPEIVTRLRKPAPGGYQADDCRWIEDDSQRYTVATGETRIDELREIMRRAAKSFDQECIYLSVAGEVEFIRPGSEYLT